MPDFLLLKEQKISIFEKYIKFVYKLKLNSMIINHNPYNMPERPPERHVRVNTESNSAQYRKNQSLEAGQNYQNFQAPTPQIRIPQPVNLMKKSSIHFEELNNGQRSPLYHQGHRQIKPFIHSPKSQHSSSSSNLPNLPASNVPRGSFPFVNHGQKKQASTKSSNNTSVKESLGISYFQFKELNQKVQSLNISFLKNEQRISEIQRLSTCSGSGFLSNNSALSIQNQQQKLTSAKNSELLSYSNLLQKMQEDWRQELKLLRSQISEIKEDVNYFCVKPSEVDRIVDEKIKNVNKFDLKIENQINNETKQVKNRLEFVRENLEEKMNKNYEYLAETLDRIEKQLHLTMNLSGDNAFKSSGVKCSGSAILLRFVESFRVRKNITQKNGEIKISLTDNTYFIDQQGYLLDKQQNYLVNSYGYQVRLEEKHLALLRQQNIIH